MKKFEVTRSYWKAVEVEAETEEEAIEIASREHLFDNASLNPGEDTAEEM